MKIGFALSGGAARGIAHIGILRAFQEMGIKPDGISGVSSGAIVGAYYCAGFNVEEILKIASKTDMFSFKSFTFGKAGLFKPLSLQAGLEKNLKGMTFEQLNLPLTVTATDIIKVESCYFSDGELIPALLASSAIPMVYLPVEYRDKLLVDGGLLNNLPIEPLKDKYDFIIGCHVNPIDKTDSNLRLRNVVDRSIHIAINNTVYYKAKKFDLFIEPPDLTHFGMFEMNKAAEIEKTGYDYVMGLKEEIEKLFWKI